MILDTLGNAARYESLHPGFRAGFAFLRRPDLATLADGRYELDGDRVFALVQHGQGKGKKAARLEAHRRYIDIQFAVAGSDVIGWTPLAACSQQGEGFLADKDVELFRGTPATWMELAPATFAVFFPDDAHAPLAMGRQVHKVVIKVAVT